MQAPPQTPPPPHGIMGLTDYRFPWEQWVAIGFGSLVLASVILYLLMKFQEKTKVVQSPVDVGPKVDPVSSLRQSLGKLSPEEPFSKAQQVSFFYELSLVFRRAVELKTGVSATDMTYTELEPVLQQKLPFDADKLGQVLTFLKQSDFIKFSDNVTTVQEAKEALVQVTGWVEDILRKEPVH